MVFVFVKAMMQMEIDMRLFPFDTQRLNIVLGRTGEAPAVKRR